MSENDRLVEAMTSMGKKYSKSEAGFSVEFGMRGLQCGECTNFLPDGKACSIVEGTVDLSNVCNFYEQSPHIGDMSSWFAGSRSFDMYITKASMDPETKEMRWAAVASDTDLDQHEDRMSIGLFNDFIERIERDEAAPVVLASEAWQGGMPYLSLAHYLDLGGRAILGDPNAIFVDGNRLKSKGIFRSTPLGEAAYLAVKADQANDVAPNERIRISIAFIDWGHSHGEKVFIRNSLKNTCPACAEGEGDKIYLKGQLIQLALTRIPVNERTPIWLEERAMAIKTIREDAEAVLGEFAPEGEIDELDKLSKAKNKKKRETYRSEAIVERSEEPKEEEPAEGIIVAETEEEPVTELVEKSPFGGAVTFDEAEEYLKQQDKMYEILDAFSMLDGVIWNIINADSDEVSDRPAAASIAISQFKERVDGTVKRSLAIRAAQMILNEESTEEGVIMSDTTETAPVVETTPAVEAEVVKTPLEKAFAQIKSLVEGAADSDAPIAERFAEIQPAFNTLAEVVKASVKGEDAVRTEELASAIGSAIRSELAPVLEQMGLAIQKSTAAPAPVTESMIPAPRAMHPSAIPVEGEREPSKILEMVNKSVGLPADSR